MRYEDLGKALMMNSAAFRMALKRESFSSFQMEVINSFLVNQTCIRTKDDHEQEEEVKPDFRIALGVYLAKNGFSQKEVAATLKRSQQAISRMLSGDNKVRWVTMFTIFSAYPEFKEQYLKGGALEEKTANEVFKLIQPQIDSIDKKMEEQLAGIESLLQQVLVELRGRDNN